MRGVIISLCDLTGAMVEPWVRNGYEAILVDPQHRAYSQEGPIERLPFTILGATEALGKAIRSRKVVFVAGFPPCTDVAVSGARWFKSKADKDRYFQARAAMVAEQCRMTGLLSGAPWFFENPVSVFSSIFGPPHYSFHPHQFTGLCEEDNYTKLTCLWTGGGFVMPEPNKAIDLGPPDNRIHKASPGPERANFRSATPRGFAEAVYMANAPHLKAQLKLFDAA